jgi:hypothetical protein
MPGHRVLDRSGRGRGGHVREHRSASSGLRRRISDGVIQIRSPGKIRCGFLISPLSFQIDGHTHGVAR